MRDPLKGGGDVCVVLALRQRAGRAAHNQGGHRLLRAGIYLVITAEDTATERRLKLRAGNRTDAFDNHGAF